MSRLERLRRLRKEEAAWRLKALGRIHRDRLAATLRRPAWDRRAIGSILAPPVVDVFLDTHIRRRDWGAVQQSLSRAFAGRPTRFLLDPANAASLRDTVLARVPGALESARERGDALLEGRFDLLGYRNVNFSGRGKAIDWHLDPIHGRRPPQRFWADVPYLNAECGDHKIIWELNRHQHWLGLGRALWLTRDRTYGQAMLTQLADWLNANPPLQGVNWASMLELGFRSISWVWALHFLLADAADGPGAFDREPWLVDLLVGLDRQLTHVEQNLSYYFSPNTHLTGEALALYVAGRAVPELRASGRWATTGRDILVREIDTQIGPDGGHAERSMHYHRYTLDFYLMALLVAERSGDHDAIGPFRDAVSRLATFARGMADRNGRLAMIGDDDGGMLWPIAGRDPADIRDSLALAAVALDQPDLAPWDPPEETLWLSGGEAPRAGAGEATEPASTVFTDTGYAVIRDEAGDHLTFDVGAHGFLNGGHAHADALAITLTVAGTPLLIDGGTGTYTMDPALRDRLRDATSHNTLTLDGRSPSVPAGPFHWRTRTDARLTAWRANAPLAWAESLHNGYGDNGHRRSVVHAIGDGWWVIDEVLGRGKHLAELHWHFDPCWAVTCESKQRLRATNFDGRVAWLVHDEGGVTLAHGDRESGVGWCSPCYGQLAPAWAATVSRHVIVPAAMVTWIGEARDGQPAPTLERPHVDGDPGAPAVSAAVIAGDRRLAILLRPGDAPVRQHRHAATAEYHSDGRLLQYELRDNRLASLSLADASHALAVRDGLPSVACDRQVDALHIEWGGETIRLWAATPPSRLQLQGLAAAMARNVTLNGRELPAPREGRRDTIVIHASAWGDHTGDARTTCAA